MGLEVGDILVGKSVGFNDEGFWDVGLGDMGDVVGW